MTSLGEIPKEVVVGLVAFVGVFISTAASVLISRWQAARALETHTAELEFKYNSALFERRITIYPDLYFALSELGKAYSYDTMSQPDVALALKRIDEWDSRNAIFVSPAVVELLLGIRGELCRHSQCDPSTVYTHDVRKQIFEGALRLEQALRNEIGVYAAKGFHGAPISKAPLHSFRYGRG